MFITLLLVTFAIAILTCLLVAKLFEQPITVILDRLIREEISTAWRRYILFATYVVGISGGVRIWELEKYITPSYNNDGKLPVLTTEHWILELYRTVIGTLQSVAWLLLVFFIFALVAYVIMRGFELRRPKVEPSV